MAQQNSYEVRTKKGYCFFEVASAFQKSIRRCDEKSAMYWAIELYESNYQKYAWKRMVIMASEDVGLATPNCICMIMALKQSYDYLVSLNERSKPEKLPFTQAVLTLVKAYKSRYVDIAISTYWNEHENKSYAMPDYVFDMHTRKGKSMGRGLQHFYDEAAKINNPRKMYNEDAMEELAKQADMRHYNPDVPIPVENISCTKEESERLLQPTLF